MKAWRSNESCGPAPTPGCSIIAEGWHCWRAPASGCAPSAIESRPHGKYEAELLLENREKLCTVDRPRVACRTTILDILAIAQDPAHVGRDPLCRQHLREARGRVGRRIVIGDLVVDR